MVSLPPVIVPPVGTRVVIRYRLDDGRATDALGTLLEIGATHCAVATKRGTEVVPIAAIIAAKPVPPVPMRGSG